MLTRKRVITFLSRSLIVIMFIGIIGGFGWYDYHRPVKQTITLQKDMWECTERRTKIINNGGKLLNQTTCVNYRRI